MLRYILKECKKFERSFRSPNSSIVAKRVTHHLISTWGWLVVRYCFVGVSGS